MKAKTFLLTLLLSISNVKSIWAQNAQNDDDIPVEEWVNQWMRNSLERGIREHPEQSAEFTGDVYKWIEEHIQYPDSAKIAKIEGRVSVQFVIGKDGRIEYTNVLRSPHPLLSAEAERLVSSMPKWKPARNNGKPVRMLYVLPIIFKISETEE